MKTLKQWVRGWLDWLAVKLGYTPKAYVELAQIEVDYWRDCYTAEKRAHCFAIDRLNKLMRYRHVQAVAAMIDAGRGRL